jgi:hypothetical protein
VTAAVFAKWSVVGIVALAMLLVIGGHMRKGRPAGEVAGSMIGLLFDTWIIVAVCVWWHP